MTNDPHDGDPSAIYEDKTPVHVGGARATPATIVSAVCGDFNSDAYLLLTRGGYGVPIARVLLRVTMCPRSQGCASRFAGGPITQFEYVGLLEPIFVQLPVQAFYVKKAVVPEVTQMAPAYATGGGGAEKLLGLFEVLDDHTEEIEVRTLVHLPYRFVSLALDQQPTPRAAWMVLGGAILSEGEAVEDQCAPLLSFLHAAAVDGLAILFEASDLDVVAPDKALEAQRMEILRRNLPARFDTGSSGGPSPGDAMTLALTAFEARTDMLERSHR